MESWTEKHGGCQCGQVRYTLTKRPTVVYCCHCTECQKQSSSAFGISVRVFRNGLTVTDKLGAFHKGSGDKQTVCEFCPDCGTRLFHNRPQYEDMLNIKGGTFDDTSWLNPAGHIWIASKQPWVTLPPGVPTYDHQPDNYNALSERWLAQ